MFDVATFDIAKFDTILSRGLSHNLGTVDGQMCIEAALCCTLGLPHGTDPRCVTNAIREFKIRLNDSSWTTPTARATGLRALGLAQLGSKGVIDNAIFAKILAEKIIGILIPKLFRHLFPDNHQCAAAAIRCEKERTAEAAYAAADAVYLMRSTHDVYAVGYATDAAKYAARVNEGATNAAYAAEAATYAVLYATHQAIVDDYLLLAAKLALDVLIELKSPGVQLLT